MEKKHDDMIKGIKEESEYFILFFIILLTLTGTSFFTAMNFYKAKGSLTKELFSWHESFEERGRQTNERLNDTDWRLKRLTSILNATVYDGNLDLKFNP